MSVLGECVSRMKNRWVVVLMLVSIRCMLVLMCVVRVIMLIF